MKCKDCGIPIYKEHRKGRPPERCHRCREKVKERWRAKNDN